MNTQTEVAPLEVAKLVEDAIFWFEQRIETLNDIAECKGGVVLASLFIVMDLDQIEKAVAARVPQEESWRCAFGLMVTLVWLYMEVLRLISILRSND